MPEPSPDRKPPPPLPAGGPEQGPVPLEQALAAFEQEDFTLSPPQRQALAHALLSLAQETTNLSVAIGSLARLLLLAEAAERPAPRPPESEQGNPRPSP